MTCFSKCLCYCFCWSLPLALLRVPWSIWSIASTRRTREKFTICRLSFLIRKLFFFSFFFLSAKKNRRKSNMAAFLSHIISSPQGHMGTPGTKQCGTRPITYCRIRTSHLACTWAFSSNSAETLVLFSTRPTARPRLLPHPYMWYAPPPPPPPPPPRGGGRQKLHIFPQINFDARTCVSHGSLDSATIELNPYNDGK